MTTRWRDSMSQQLNPALHTQNKHGVEHSGAQENESFSFLSVRMESPEVGEKLNIS